VDVAVKPLAFVGRVPSSKSLLNRLWVVKSYFPELQIRGDSQCDDVLRMQAAVQALERGEPIDAGDAGTVLRFMALRASRLAGHHVINGSRRLFERPQTELLRILNQLGVKAELEPQALRLISAGWKLHGDTLSVSSHQSSQFATAVLLNSWSLPFDLYVSLSGQRVSEGYWRMTLKLVEQLGMKLDFWDNDFRVLKQQRSIVSEFDAESDMSSAFALAAIAAVNGRATFLDFPENSLQPDAQFVAILKTMGVPIELSQSTLKVEHAKRGLNGVSVNLKSAPDLFPVLAALCALAEGESELYGAPQLVHKESNRLERMAEWIRQVGRNVEVRADGLRIFGPRGPCAPLLLDSDHDHRLAFAAAVWRAADLPVEISHPEVVNKSFPEFWNTLGWSL
jgi:3-phosphoshikimate 1-carboxyvinyltransferase